MATGDFCHIQFSSTDISKTKTFFTNAFGWTFQDIPGFETYAMFQTPSGLGGGVDTSERADPPSDQGPILHIEVEDIDATLVKIIEMGGKTISPKMKISDEFGSAALFLDNVGNRFGLWSA